ncbi:ubiquitin carboxyl-terminal hydrolase 47-like [Platysternon megacephalum]|uniref:Ubiquitin carboxyl-terminal hydrolase 47-like n=1 Tax=Platysternon megacephalum TaxID=55544 RepID=A0A4D9DRW7_9SAUR|nr:ubiquitin carboxyl-terminal hydrolase 47-like [Platysternon megacephalum]
MLDHGWEGEERSGEPELRHNRSFTGVTLYHWHQLGLLLWPHKQSSDGMETQAQCQRTDNHQQCAIARMVGSDLPSHRKPAVGKIITRNSSEFTTIPPLR